MSDARLRELERRWKETGSVDDEAAYLLERVRVGDLTRERLELAAYCGLRLLAGKLSPLNGRAALTLEEDLRDDPPGHLRHRDSPHRDLQHPKLHGLD